MEKKLKLKAYAKVNLQLDVTGRRADGYHELAGVMQRISLFDEVEISASDMPSAGNSDIEVIFDEPVPYRNTVRTAAELFLEGSGYRVSISVKKNIPSEAGLGGASADAAAVLRGLNALFAGTGLERSEEELYAMGLRVGADVPFCLHGGCAIAAGVGEKLTALSVVPMALLVVKGDRGVSTAALFKSIDEAGGGATLPEGSLERLTKAVLEGDIAGIGMGMKNALQPAAEIIAPEIAELTLRMRQAGAIGACMTGSGAAVIGLFPDKASAVEARTAFADCAFAMVCNTIN